MQTRVNGTRHELLRPALATGLERDIFISQLPKANPDKHMIRRNLCENIVTRESRGEEEKNKQIIKVRIDSKTMWSLFLRINI